MFDGRSKHLQDLLTMSIIKDCSMILLIILPLFVLGLRFWSSPVYLMYTLRINAFICPVALIPIFFCEHIDVSLLGILVLFMNIYVFWYHCDPPVMNDYNAGRYQRSSRVDDSSDDNDTNYKNR